MAKPGSGLLLDPQQTALTMNQRIMFNRLVAQGTPAAVARQVAIAVAKREGLTPPSGVQSACKRGLELAPEFGGQGLTDGAKARARSMAAGNSVSPDQVRRMHSFFSRHDSYEKQSSPPSPGYVSWQLWGGDAGKRWAASNVEKIDKSEQMNAVMLKNDAKINTSRRRALARACAQARVQARKADSDRPDYHKAFAEAAKAILPVGVTEALHRRARAVAGGHGKAAAVAYAQGQDMGLPVAKAEPKPPDIASARMQKAAECLRLVRGRQSQLKPGIVIYKGRFFPAAALPLHFEIPESDRQARRLSIVRAAYAQATKGRHRLVPGATSAPAPRSNSEGATHHAAA